MKKIKNKFYQWIKFFFMDIVIDVCLFLILFSCSLSYWTKDIHQIFGIAISLVSLGLWILSRIHLGKSFTVSAKAKKLVTKGMYSKIRNPIYIFSLLAFTGVLISIGKPKLFLFLLPFLAMETIRASKEKKVLYETFGEAYKAYRKKTWF